MRERMLTSAIVAVFCVTAAPAPAGPLRKSEVSPAANWVVHANLETFRNSTVGKLIMDELQTQGFEQKLQGFATIFSFHPLRDVRDVTLYGQGKDRNNAVVIIDGRFDPEKLLAVVRWNQQYQEIPYQGATLHGWLNEEQKGGQTTSQMMYGYIHNKNQVVLSAGLDALKRAADTLKTPAADTASTLLKEVPEGQNNVFFQAVATDVERIAGPVGEQPQAALLRQTDSLALTVGETTDKVFVTLQLEGESAEVADSMLKVLQGLIAFAQLASQEQPRLAELARGVTVSRLENVAQVRLEAAPQTVAGFLREQWEKKKQQQPQTPAP